jgi:hypothetical protein
MVIEDFMSFEECLTRARDAINDPRRHIAKQILGVAGIDYCAVFAAQIAWECAAEATRRAQQRSEREESYREGKRA